MKNAPRPASLTRTITHTSPIHTQSHQFDRCHVHGSVWGKMLWPAGGTKARTDERGLSAAAGAALSRRRFQCQKVLAAARPPAPRPSVRPPVRADCKNDLSARHVTRVMNERQRRTGWSLQEEPKEGDGNQQSAKAPLYLPKAATILRTKVFFVPRGLSFPADRPTERFMMHCSSSAPVDRD